MKFLNRELRGKDGESKMIREVINPKEDFWERGGQGFIKHVGILKMKEFVGAKFEKPELIDKPSRENDFGFYFICSAEFPDGEISYEAGEANNLNTTMDASRQYKMTMAMKRGRDRAFLRSAYVGLQDVYSESEADTFKFGEEREETSMDPKFVYLPKNDEKYPNERVLDVWKEHRDREYIETLLEYKSEILTVKEEEMIRWVAKGIIFKLEEREKEAQASVEEEAVLQ